MRWLGKLGAVVLLGVWPYGCGRVQDLATEASGGSSEGGHASSSGTAGQFHLNVPEGGVAGETTFYPPPFDRTTCPSPVPRQAFGSMRCVTRAQLADPDLPNVALDGGLAALGSENAWRCPRLNEILFSSADACGGEHCCNVPLCGPVTSRLPPAQTGSGGASEGGAADADPLGEQLCCYYVAEECGV